MQNLNGGFHGRSRFAAMCPDAAWNAHGMQSITKALARMLSHQEPFPAMIIDCEWNVLTSNESAPKFFNCFIDMAARKGPSNMLHIVFDPDGLWPFIANWQSVGERLVQRVYRESVARAVDDKTRDFHDRFLPAHVLWVGAGEVRVVDR